MWSFVLLLGQGGECPDTVRILTFLAVQFPALKVVVVPYGSTNDQTFRRKANGKFNGRNNVGRPVLLVLKDEAVEWACAIPTEPQLQSLFRVMDVKPVQPASNEDTISGLILEGGGLEHVFDRR